uniref:Uncharacterized protein n=1 Tax=Timema cristinae TaxID=61476 RepID=A0A7R9DDL1_TIMCR|nr:unnamed protein product [Timema cristinae]
MKLASCEEMPSIKKFFHLKNNDLTKVTWRNGIYSEQTFQSALKVNSAMEQYGHLSEDYKGKILGLVEPVTRTVKFRVQYSDREKLYRFGNLDGKMKTTSNIVLMEVLQAKLDAIDQKNTYLTSRHIAARVGDNLSKDTIVELIIEGRLHSFAAASNQCLTEWQNSLERDLNLHLPVLVSLAQHETSTLFNFTTKIKFPLWLNANTDHMKDKDIDDFLSLCTHNFPKATISIGILNKGTTIEVSAMEYKAWNVLPKTFQYRSSQLKPVAGLFKRGRLPLESSEIL